MGFLRQEYWSVLPFPSPGDILNPGIEPRSPAFAGGFFTTEPPGSRPEFRVLALGLAADTRLLGKTARL